MVWLIVNAAIVGSTLYALPFVVGDFWAFTLALYYLYAIACLGVGLSWGQAGLLSLGQGLFVGIGAYLSGLSLISYSDSNLIYPILGFCVIITGILAYGIGRLIFHGRAQSGAFFALITLGLVLLAAQTANSWKSVTGGFNGLSGIPSLPGLGEFKDAYTLSAVALGVSMLFVAWIITTPLGVLWRATAQNEKRVAFLGFDYNNLKAIAFGLSGLLGGLAGVIFAPENNLVTPDLFGFALSTSFVVWVAIGGRSTLYGPVVGAVAIGLLTANLRETVSYWEVILAVLFIASVLYFRSGVFGFIEPLLHQLLSPANRPVLKAPAKTNVQHNGTFCIQNLNLHVGNVRILNDLNLRISEPGIYCLIGPNGAGKTSTFNAVTGELVPQTSSLEMMGKIWTKPDPCALARAGLARKFQIPSVFDDLTIGENIGVAMWTSRANIWDLISYTPLYWTTPVLQELESRFPFLTDRLRKVYDLSHGQRQMLDLSMTLCTEPHLILLDEPCAGLSPAEAKQVIDTIRWAVTTFKATALIIEHDMTLVRELADRVYVLHNGRLLAEGAVAEIQNNAAVKAVYSGGER